MITAISANQNETAQMSAVKAQEDKKVRGEVKSVNMAGVFANNGLQGQIDAKRRNAQKQAMKIIGDAWENDQNAAKNIEDMSNLKNEKVMELNEQNKQKKGIEESKQKLQQEYGIASDSQEQKDTELLEKYQNSITGASDEHFSEEEIDRLKELQNTPLTEYQKRVLTLNARKGEMTRNAEKLQNAISGLTSSITDASIEQLKSRGMEMASDAAEEIMGAANEEIFGMLIADAKENMDEKLEEEKEKAEEISEKKEEQDEQIEESKENRREQEELIEGQLDMEQLKQTISAENQTVSQTTEAQKAIQNILEENHLVSEDIKGIEIDLNF